MASGGTDGLEVRDPHPEDGLGHPRRVCRPGSVVRGGGGGYWVQSWSSESWAAGQPVLPVMVARQYRWVDAGKVKVTVLFVAGEKA